MSQQIYDNYRRLYQDRYRAVSILSNIDIDAIRDSVGVLATSAETDDEILSMMDQLQKELLAPDSWEF